MAEYSKEEMQIGIGKEAVARGTEAAALAITIPADRGSDMDYHPVFVEDEKTRGIKDRFKPTVVMKEGVGAISGMPVEPLNIGYFLRSLMGSVSSSLVGTTAYEHTITRLAGVQMPSYTFVIDRGISKKAYTLGVVKSMTLNSAFNDKLMADFEILFQSEAVSVLAMPSLTEPAPFIYPNLQIYLADVGASKPGSADSEIREFSLTIDNQSIIKRTYNNSLNIKDIVTPEKILISGTFVRYFDTEDERNDFVAGTARAMWVDITGSLIETTYYNALNIELPQIFYKAFPFGDVEGMFAAAVAFDAYYYVTGAKSISMLLRNTDTAY